MANETAWDVAFVNYWLAFAAIFIGMPIAFALGYCCGRAKQEPTS